MASRCLSRSLGVSLAPAVGEFRFEVRPSYRYEPDRDHCEPAGDSEEQNGSTRPRDARERPRGEREHASFSRSSFPHDFTLLVEHRIERRGR
ncbi:hypothetical protein BRC68_05675 [Halobacteriales archaeon QH_6_64_20]|nr:MAG: hypothetical protein BRC68_05675 [Halobacteriales archaeon QH_6_64_20]